MAGRSIIQGCIIFTLCGTGGSAQYVNCTDGIVENIGDGYCTVGNNNEGCLYDGGDCCQCTAIDDGSFSSDTGSLVSTCVDPSSPCYSPTAAALQSNCTDGDFMDIGDGWCDEDNNNEGCLYDGGDCCQCTAIDDGSFSSDTGSLVSTCVDPSSPCYSPTAAALQSNCTDGDFMDIGDGWCDEDNNNEGCLYDGGDCCQCTTIDDGSFSSDTGSHFSTCVDPSSPCYSPTAAALQSNCTDGDFVDIGDGWCDEDNNNEGCLYDGGDCCQCTTIDDGSFSSDTGSLFSTCVDPTSPCYSPTAAALRSSCTDGNIASIANGACNVDNNNEGCLYDGGDCCSCTCIDGAYTDCGSSGFPCLDPEVADLEPYICEESHLNNTTCPTRFQRKWIVENTTQARLLAEAVRCFGGVFDVTWNGKVIVDKTISIFDGTVLNIISTEEDSAIDGDGTTRLFSVVNASLHVSNITLSSGSARYGGAVAASRATLSFDGVAFIGHIATNDGGALHLSNGTTVFFGRDTSFSGNSAQHAGGAIYVMGAGNLSWTGNTLFSDNMATLGLGGALYVMDSSTVWTAEAHFLHNTAGSEGGALLVTEGSNSVWTAEAYFLHNTAGSKGGALSVTEGSNSFWTAEAYFVNNSAKYWGGAVYLAYNSSAAWTAEACFMNNSVDMTGGLSAMTSNGNVFVTYYGGGALYVISSSNAVWTAEAYFLHNTAGSEGGALLVAEGSNSVWAAETLFFNNSAEIRGGSLFVTGGSFVSWEGQTNFSRNSALSDGGALYVYSASRAKWTASCVFSGNSALSDGGALYVSDTSSANWTSRCVFESNSALSNGGAVYASDSVSLSWSNKNMFVDNSARNGGAIFASNAVITMFSGETNFNSNYATLNGGAVGYVSAHDHGSLIIINGATSFIKNECGGSGGAMSLVRSLASVSENANVNFLRNSAGASGGAVYIAFAVIGTVFKEVAFVENFAQIGGGVHSTGSGTDVTVKRDIGGKTTNPTTFYGCSFIGNHAFATGGAVDTSSGRDVFVNTWFKDNKARVGGALNLAGIVSIDNCSFEENVSELGGGPAVSNNGYMSNVTNSYFNHNKFKCDANMFLHFDASAIPFGTVCDGCPSTCFGCSFGEGQGSPTCMSLSEAGVEHATTKGGYTTIEELVIHKGYWRATNTSTNILRCFNTKACKGGLTGASDYCARGYEGPYCSVCIKNYVSSLRFNCGECFDRTTVVVTASVLLGLALGVVIAIVSYLVSAEVSDSRRGITDYMMQRIPLQSLKTIIILWQILTQFTSVVNVKFPSVYQTFLDGVNFFNFDLSWLLSAGCLLKVDFHDRLLWTTISPLVTMGLLGITYTIAMHRNLTSPETTIRNIQHKHVSMALLVTILVYSSVSSVVFQMFACDDLDDGKRYLHADYTIDCDASKHRVLQIYSVFMILLYPVGIPALYSSLMFWNSTSSAGSLTLQEKPLIRSIWSLWKPYKPRRFYYEVFECARRISLTGVIVFIYPNSAAQVAATFAIAVVFIFVSEGMAPYASPWDAWMSRMGQAIIFASMYLALLLKVNVSGENDASQKMFEAVLVACHGCMVLAVVIQIVIMALSLRVVRQREDPRPRLRRPVNLALDIQPCLIEEDDISKDEP